MQGHSGEEEYWTTLLYRRHSLDQKAQQGGGSIATARVCKRLVLSTELVKTMRYMPSPCCMF